MAADGIGVLTFTELAPRRRYSATNGWTVVRRWNGHKDNLDSFLNASLPTGFLEYSIEIEGKIAIVEANYGASSATDVGSGGASALPDPITEQWSMASTMQEISLWQHPDVLAQYMQMTAAERAAIVQKINDGLSANTPAGEMAPWPTIRTAIETHVESAGMSPFQSLYERLMAGIEVMPRSLYTLRKTLTVANYSKLKASHAKVNHILTYAQLRSIEPNWQVAALVDSQNLTKYVWLKLAPNIDPVDRGAWQITQEYLGFKNYDKWVHLDWTESERDVIPFVLTPS